MDKIIDNIPWLWEKFGMSGIIVGSVLLILFFILKGMKSSVVSQLETISSAIDAEMSHCNASTNDIDQIICLIIEAKDDLRCGGRDTKPGHLLTVSRLYQNLQQISHYGIFYWVKQGYIKKLQLKYPDIECLTEPETIQFLKEHNKLFF